MSKLQKIEIALSAINPAAFQELCDSYLALRNSNYSAFARTGSQSGKQKTIKGPVDTFLRLPNGKYIFIEYSTDVTAGVYKLQKDLNKCIDSNKTGVLVDDIAEIIVCTNFNISTKDIQNLESILLNTSIKLTVYMLDSLALELHLNHRNLASDYLGLPLDTGQIVSMETFVKEYQRKSHGVATPLDNTFLHRENELKELKDAIFQNDFVILTGAAGIGKTKLALETVKDFLTEHPTFSSYCVSYKNHALLEDLYQYFDSSKDYILFVDDANRIDAFSQITGFYKGNRTGKLKILITVRDYAFQDIGMLCNQFAPKRYNLSKLSDEQITDIIKASPFNILNPDYHKEIVRIADGNPRLAIMTALLANAEQNIYVLSNVSQLFETYFSTFIEDNGEFADALNIKILGLISFFFTIPYKNKELVEEVLKNFGIEYSAFIDTIDKLEKLELVEIRFEHVKVPEQNLATYFFYKAFVKDNLLSFEILLDKYFDSNTKRFTECVVPTNNIMGRENVMPKLQPSLTNYLNAIRADEERAFNFLSVFWFYLLVETQEFLYSFVQALEETPVLKYEVSYDKNIFQYEKNKVIYLVGELLRIPQAKNLKDTLELGFEYAKKCPNDLPELLHIINERLIYDSDDWRTNFISQDVLFKVLTDGVNRSNKLLSVAFYELSKKFLGFKFRHTKGARGNSFVMYTYPIPNNLTIRTIRKRIWDCIGINFPNNTVLSFEVLKHYGEFRHDVSRELMEFDADFLLPIIESQLSTASFEHCIYVQNQIQVFRSNSVSHSLLSKLATEFTNPIYELFLKVDWDRLRDKEIFEFGNHEEYQKLKEAYVREQFSFKNLDELHQFYNGLSYLWKLRTKSIWGFAQTLEIVIDENCAKDFELGCHLLISIIEDNNDIGYVPRRVFRNQLNTREKAQKIWDIIHPKKKFKTTNDKYKEFLKAVGHVRFDLYRPFKYLLDVQNEWRSMQEKDYRDKTAWELAFYDFLDDSLVDESYAYRILKTIQSIPSSDRLHFDGIKRYLKFAPDLFHQILQIIVNKNNENTIQIQLWVDFFIDSLESLSADLKLLKTAYLQQVKFDHYFDYDGKVLLNILKYEPNFLYEYVEHLYIGKDLGLSGSHDDLSLVWKVDGIEPILEKVFALCTEKEPFWISAHFCNAFFRNLSDIEQQRAKDFLFHYCKEHYKDSTKMNIVVDITRNAMKDIYDEFLLHFLSITQDKDLFAEISWRGSGTSGSGDDILSDIEAADWRNVLSIVERSELGISLIPIRQYLNEQIESSLRHGDQERLQKFMGRF